MAVSHYFTPHYFAGSYFRCLDPGNESASTSVTDHRVYSSLVASVRGTRLLDRVVFPGPAPPAVTAPAGRAWAVIAPTGWQEIRDARGRLALRVLDLQITLGLTLFETVLAMERLERVIDAVVTAVDGSSLGGIVVAGATCLSRGRWELGPGVGEVRVILPGQVAYIVDASTPRPGSE